MAERPLSEKQIARRYELKRDRVRKARTMLYQALNDGDLPGDEVLLRALTAIAEWRSAYDAAPVRVEGEATER